MRGPRETSLCPLESGESEHEVPESSKGNAES